VGRPKAPPKTNAARLLDNLGVDYSVVTVEIDESDLSAEKAAKLLGLPFELVYKTILLKGQPHGLIEACLPAGYELDLKAMAKASSQRSVTLVPLKDLFPLTGYHRGGCSPLAGRHHFPVYVHEDVTKLEKMAINAGARGVMLLLAPYDFITAVQAIPANIVKPKS
jgi:Cys-tRNA(Pro)/Cys-tRNA(Cys) deacylase